MTGAGPYLLAAGVGLSAVGTVMQASSAAAQSKAAAANAENQRQVAERNQKIADENRRLALAQGEIDAEDQRRENRRRLSEIRTVYGASGLALAGTPLDVLADAATEGELDAQRVSYEGRVRARESALQMLGLQDQANMSALEASAARSQARSAMWSGVVGAGATLASGAARVSYYNRTGKIA